MSFLSSIAKVFKRTNKVSTKNPADPAKKRGKFSIFSSIFLSTITLASGGTGIGISIWKYKAGSEFNKSYNIRFELDLNHSENPYSDNNLQQYKKANLVEDAKEALNQSADAYSRYLHSKNIDNFNVYPEYIHNGNDDNNIIINDHAYINAILPNETYEKEISYDKNKTLDKDPVSTYIKYVNDSRLSIVMNLYSQQEGDNNGKIVVIPLNDIISNNNDDISFSSDKLTVNIKLKNSLSNYVNNYFKNVKDGEKNSIINNSDIYIVRDLNGLVNRCMTDLQVDYLKERNSNVFSGDLDNPANIQRYYDNMDATEKIDGEFYKNIKANLGIGNGFLETVLHNEKETENKLIYANYQIPSTGPIELKMDDKNSKTDVDTPLGVLPILFDSDGKQGQDDSKPDDHDVSKVKYDFMQQYVMALGKSSDIPEKNADPDATSFLNILPNKSPKDKKVDVDQYNWLTIKAKNLYTSQDIYNCVKDFNFKLPVLAMNNGNGLDGFALNNENDQTNNGVYFGFTKNDMLYGIKNQVKTIDKTLTNNVFGNTALFGAFIALMVIIVLIGIIVSILYRIPGAMGFLSILAATSLTAMIMLLTGYVVTTPLLIGLFAGMIGGMLSIFLLMARIRRQTKANVPFEVAFTRGIKRGILPMLDIHFVMLIIAFCVTYFADVQITDFGSSLLILSLLSIGFVIVLWPITMWLLFRNKINMHRRKLAYGNWVLFKNHQNNNKIDLNNKVYETTFYSGFEQKKFNIFGWKQILVMSIIIAIVIIGVILLFTIGSHASYSFYGGTRLVLDSNDISKLTNEWAKYNYKIDSDGWTYLYYGFNPDTTLLTTLGIEGINYFVESINNGSVIIFLKNSINMILIASGFLSAYALIRLNWVSVISVFISTTFLPLLMLGLISLIQIPFDLNIVLAITLIYTINAYFTISLIANLNNRWLRKQVLNHNDLKYVMNLEFKNDLIFYLFFYAFVILSFTILLLMSSTNLVITFAICLIGLLTTAPILYSITPILLYLFLVIKYHYLTSSSEIVKTTKRNYDNVDEQLIPGINKRIKQNVTI